MDLREECLKEIKKLETKDSKNLPDLITIHDILLARQHTLNDNVLKAILLKLKEADNPKKTAVCLKEIVTKIL